MNIFYLHPDPVKAAQYHYNRHIVKMPLEAAQMLCGRSTRQEGQEETEREKEEQAPILETKNPLEDIQQT